MARFATNHVSYSGIGLADVPALVFRLCSKLDKVDREQKPIDYSSAVYWQAML
jgi:hypothetical protein